MDKEQVVIDGRVVVDVFPANWSAQDSAELLMRILSRRVRCHEYYEEKAKAAAEAIQAEP